METTFQVGEWVQLVGFLKGEIVELRGPRFVIEHSTGAVSYGHVRDLRKIETHGQIYWKGAL